MSDSSEGATPREIDVEVVDHDIVEPVANGCEYRYPPIGEECNGDGWHELTVERDGEETTLLLCELHTQRTRQRGDYIDE